VQFAGEAEVLPGKIDKDVDFKPERPDEVFGLAEKTPRESLRIPTRIHSTRKDSAPPELFTFLGLAPFSAPALNARAPHIPDFAHNTARPPKYGQHTRRSFAFRIQRLRQHRDAATAAKATLAAAIVEAMSAALWAADMNPASNWDGAR